MVDSSNSFIGTCSTIHSSTHMNEWDCVDFVSHRTPLIRLEKLSEETGCNIMVKAEMANGGGSVKDRAARFLIKQAVEQGLYYTWRGGVVFTNEDIWDV